MPPYSNFGGSHSQSNQIEQENGHFHYNTIKMDPSQNDQQFSHETEPTFIAETPMLASNRDVALKNSMHAYQWTLKDFDIGGYLGDGAHGTVFLARERRTGYICVLKCIAKSHLIRGSQEALLKKEVELQAHLKHPHITCVYTWFDTPSSLFLVMEYCYYGDLFKYLQNYGPFDEPIISRMLFEITWAIRTCHDKRIAHLDLKPENVLINHNGKCKLADFGLSAHIGSKQYRKGLHINRGTYDYWSPEQCARSTGSSNLFGDFNQKTDIWTIGILSYELMFNRPPFGSTVGNEFLDDEKAKQVVMRRIQTYHWSQVGIEQKYLEISKLSLEYKNFLETCLDKSPENRPTAEKILLHPFIVKYNQDRLNDPAFLNQPRGGQITDGISNSPINHFGFNDQRGAFLTPRPLETSHTTPY